MSNYEIYFGTLERAIDTFANYVEYPYDHPRKEVRDFHDEIRKTGATKWLQQQCVDKRWWANINERSTKMS